MQLNELVKESHGMAKEKGWWDEEVRKRPLECHALVVSEMAEAMEEVRKHPREVLESGAVGFYLSRGDQDGPACPATAIDIAEALRGLELGAVKPEGEAVELADAIIRIADYFGVRGWDLEAVVRAKMAYNATRSKRHGGKSA